MNHKINFNILILLLSFSVVFIHGQNVKITFPFSVVDSNGKFFADMKSSDLQILQDKVQLKVDSLVKKSGNALELVILIDASASQERMLPIEKKMAEILIDSILKQNRDKVAIVKLTGKISTTQNFTDNFEKAKAELRKIEFEAPSGYVGGGIVIGKPPTDKNQLIKGSSSIWDSVNETMTTFFDAKKSDAHQVVLLISDGVNTYGKSKVKDAVALAVKKQIPIYAIGIGDKNYDGVDKNNLKKLTSETGGELIVPAEKMDEFQQQVLKMEQGLRSRYELTLISNSTFKSDSLKEMEIKIINSEISSKQLRIIKPKGFFYSQPQ